MQEYEQLPTGKPHISFSELKDWKECSFRHHLKFVQKLVEDRPGVHMDFGTAVHAACENFLKTGKMSVRVFKEKLHELWMAHAKISPEAFTVEAFKQFAKEGLAILPEVPAWLDKTFPGWEFVDAEHALYEPIAAQPHAFKGFVDCIIKAPGPRGKKLYWLLDFKTCSWGWPLAKKNDENIKAQLVLYKNYWAVKAKIDPADIRTGFILLKRTGRPAAKCELVTVSVGETTTKKSLTVVNNMLASVKKGISVKNRQSCKFCDYFETKHCT